MPVTGHWLTYRYISVQPHFYDYVKAQQGGIRNTAAFQSSGGDALSEGISFGFCVQWLRRLQVQGNETSIDRMEHLLGDLDQAATIQYFYNREFTPWLWQPVSFGHLARMFSTASRDFGLNFRYAFSSEDPRCLTGLLKILFRIEMRKAYLIQLSGFNVSGSSTVNDYNHVIALVYPADRDILVLDPNLGEVEFEELRLEHFLEGLSTKYADANIFFENLHFFEVAHGSFQDVAADDALVDAAGLNRRRRRHTL